MLTPGFPALLTNVVHGVVVDALTLKIRGEWPGSDSPIDAVPRHVVHHLNSVGGVLRVFRLSPRAPAMGRITKRRDASLRSA